MICCLVALGSVRSRRRENHWTAPFATGKRPVHGAHSARRALGLFPLSERRGQARCRFRVGSRGVADPAESFRQTGAPWACACCVTSLVCPRLATRRSPQTESGDAAAVDADRSIRGGSQRGRQTAREISACSIRTAERSEAQAA